jgi:hypothetical protein
MYSLSAVSSPIDMGILYLSVEMHVFYFQISNKKVKNIWKCSEIKWGEVEWSAVQGSAV